MSALRPRAPARARAWAHVAQSAVMRRVAPGWVPRPHAAHCIVTYRCNLRCVSCHSWRVNEHADLTAAEWRGVFRQLRSLDVVKVLGGEPFVRDDMVELLRSVREEVDPYLLQLTSNGMFRRRLVEAVHAVAWPGLQLRISVDGMEATHDQMRGVPGSWRKVTTTVREVAALQGRYGFKLGINFAVTDRSVGELDAMVRFAEEVGADLIPGFNVDPFLDGRVPPEARAQRVVHVTDRERVLRALEDARLGTRRELPIVDHLYARFITNTTYRSQLEAGRLRFPCRELRDLVYLQPNGDLVRCGMDSRPIGNLREHTFDALWFGEVIRPWRAKVDACPGCLQTSIQILSRLYGGCVTA